MANHSASRTNKATSTNQQHKGIHMHYTTVNGKLSGRASYGYGNVQRANTFCDEQNAKAESLGIKARYEVKECFSAEIPEKEHRL